MESLKSYLFSLSNVSLIIVAAEISIVNNILGGIIYAPFSG
jgi:hypothetical protein